MSEQKITIKGGTLNVPDQPVIPYIESDVNGVEIRPAAYPVFPGYPGKTG